MIDPGFTTPPMAAIFTASARVQMMLRVEGALARSQAADAVIPATSANEIAAVCALTHPHAEQLLLDGWEAGTPVLPLLDYVRSQLSPQGLPHVHYLATTQDIVDTAMMLHMQQAFSVLDSFAGNAAASLAGLSQYGDLPIMTRTFLQPAEPSTFNLRLAHWLSPLLDGIEAMREAQFPLQFGGAIGDRFGQRWSLTLANELFLHPRFIPWHTDRQPIVDLVEIIGRLVRWAAKVAGDLVFLAQSGEATMRAGGSTAMVHKRNPIDAIRALAAADAFYGVASIITASRPHELERAAGSWHAEWFAIPLIAQTASATLDAVGRALESLTIHSADVVVPPGRAEAASVLASATLDRSRDILGVFHPWTMEDNSEQVNIT